MRVKKSRCRTDSVGVFGTSSLCLDPRISIPSLLLERLTEQLTSLEKQPSVEQKSRELQNEIRRKNFSRADTIKEITVSCVPLNFLRSSISSLFLQTSLKSFIPEQQALTLLKLSVLQNQANCEVLEELMQQKDDKFNRAYAAYTECTSDFQSYS